MTEKKNIDGLVVRNLQKDEIARAENLVRLAFGTFLGFPDPSANPLKKQMISHRFHQNPQNVLAAVLDGELVGSNVLTRWGSFAFFGPLTVRPDLWNSGVGARLVKEALEAFANDGSRNLGLFTFSDSPKHLGLYHKFGFCSRFLTPIMEKQITLSEARAVERHETFSNLNEREKQERLEEVRELTNTLYPDLELSSEIRLTNEFRMGDTLFIANDSKELVGFAICQSGEKTEAGLNRCYVKFGAARPGPRSATYFERLLSACQSYAAEKEVETIEAGVNLSHDVAFDIMLNHGFRTSSIGVAMQKPNEPAHCRPENFVIDDWR